MDERRWFRGELLRLTELGVIRKTGENSHVSRVFLVPKKGPSKWRMVVDLRHVNHLAVGESPERSDRTSLG